MLLRYKGQTSDRLLKVFFANTNRLVPARITLNRGQTVNFQAVLLEWYGQTRQWHQTSSGYLFAWFAVDIKTRNTVAQLIDHTFSFTPQQDGTFLVQVQVLNSGGGQNRVVGIAPNNTWIAVQGAPQAPTQPSAFEDRTNWWWAFKITWDDETKVRFDDANKHRASVLEARTYCASFLRTPGQVATSQTIVAYYSGGNPAKESRPIQIVGTWSGNTFDAQWQKDHRNRGAARLTLRNTGQLTGWWTNRQNGNKGGWEFLRTSTPSSQKCPY